MEALLAHAKKEEKINPFRNYYTKYMNVIEKWDDETIKKRLIAGLRDNSFHPMPITIGGSMDHPADALENFVEELSKKYKARKDEDT
jgi:hypothetical protein